jgi:hypothetical protein
VLGYKPWELHRVTFREVLLAIEGLHEQNKFYHDLLGKGVSFICASGMYGKAVLKSFRKDWFGEKTGGGKISERALEQLRQLRKVEAQKSALEKIKNKNA